MEDVMDVRTAIGDGVSIVPAVRPVVTPATAAVSLALISVLAGGGHNAIQIFYNEPIESPEKVYEKTALKREFTLANGLTVYMDEYSEEARARIKNLDKLKTMELFQNGWNGYGAKAFDKVLLDRVRSILEEITRQPEIFPIAGGSVQMEFDKDDNSYLEMEINTSEKIEVYCEDSSGAQREFTIPDKIEEINKVVQAFYG